MRSRTHSIHFISCYCAKTAPHLKNTHYQEEIRKKNYYFLNAVLRNKESACRCTVFNMPTKWRHIAKYMHRMEILPTWAEFLWGAWWKSSLVAASRQAALLQGQCQITEATSLVQVKQTTSLRKIPVTVCAICTSIAFKKDSRHWEVVLLLPLYHQEKSIILSIDIVSINSRILMWNSRDQRALGSGSTERDLA